MRVAVVGGGVTGLTAAYRLRTLLGDTAEITVLETRDRPGGVLRTVELAGTPFDVGAEAFLARRPEVPALAAELGLAAELVHPGTAAASVRAGGARVGLPTRTVMGIPADADAVAGVLDAGALPAIAAERELPPVKLDGDVAVGELVRRRFGPQVTERLVDPLLGGVYAGRAEALGLRATVPALAAALDRAPSTLSAAVAGLLPPPSDGPRAPVFGAFRGGWARLLAALEDAARAEILLGRPVRALARTNAGWTLEFGSAAAPEHRHADAVVLAVPAPSARKLLAGLTDPAATALGAIELASMAVVGLALPAGAALPDNSGVLLASGERHADGTPFTAKAFTFSGRKWPHLAGEHVLLRGSVGRHGEAHTLQVGDDELLAAVRADLAELTGITAEPVDTVVARWGGGLPQYGVGHLELVRTITDAVAALPGLAIAGALLHGVGVPACVATADAAARTVAGYLTGELSRPGSPPR